MAQVADSVNALADALTVSESREREFLLSVTHELRTPLTAVKGFAEAVADGVATGDAARQAGAVILAESTRLEHLIGDLLDLARLGAKDFSVTPVPVNLTAAMDAAATVWRARCGEVGVEFTADLPPFPLVLSTDAARVRQIVDGLIENALRVTPAGRGIRLTLRAEGRPGADAATRCNPLAERRSRSRTAARGSPPTTVPWHSSDPLCTSDTAACDRWEPGWGWHWCRRWPLGSAAPRASPRPPAAELSSRSGFRVRHRSGHASAIPSRRSPPTGST